MIKIFSWNPTKPEQDLLYQLINATFGEDEPSQVIDLNTSTISTQDDDILIACGTRCYNLVTAEAPPEMSVTKIPLARNLTNAPANKTDRINTFGKLKELSENKDTIFISQEVLSTDDLPALSISQLTKLKETLEIKGVDHWIGKTPQGRKIAIVLDPDKQIQNCHVVLTFEEVFAAKIAAELLNLETLTLVTGDK